MNSFDFESDTILSNLTQIDFPPLILDESQHERLAVVRAVLLR